jgi:hypothetical protein
MADKTGVGPGVRSGRGSEGPLNNVQRPQGGIPQPPAPTHRPVPKTLDHDTLHPIDNDVVGDVSNVGSMGPVLPGIATGDAQWGGHKDAALVRLQDHDLSLGAAGDGTEYYKETMSSPDALQAHAPDAFAPSDSLQDK